MLQYLTLIDWFVLVFCLALFYIAIFVCYIDEKLQKRLMTLFTGWTDVEWTTKPAEGFEYGYTYRIPIPNALIVASYLFCCVMAIILLP